MGFEEQEIINDCTIIRADSMEAIQALEDNSVDCIVSDPPYGVSNLKAASSAYDDVVPDLSALWNHTKRIRKPACVTTLFAAGQNFPTDLILSNREEYRYTLVWVKSASEHDRPYVTGFLDCKNRPLRAYENVLIFIPKGQYRASTYNPQMSIGTPYKTRAGRSARLYNVNRLTTTTSNGTRYPNDILYYQVDTRRCDSRKTHEDSFHPSSKPTSLMEWLVRTYSNENEIVLDPFMGSGTTGVACVQTGRKFIGIEIEKKWYDLACQRIEKAYKERDERMLTSTGDAIGFQTERPLSLFESPSVIQPQPSMN
jgi:site-specific DNA-methyltransferase (adenine-specific)